MNQHRSERVRAANPRVGDPREPQDSVAGPAAPAAPDPSSPNVVKPTVEELGIDPAAADWSRTGTETEGFEVAFFGEWILVRLAGDPAGPVLVYDHHEWRCFLAGAKGGEFDDVARVGH